MRIVLEVVSGPSAGRKARLGAGQELRIGRTEWADFSVPQDGRMSGVHFALETDNLACYVQDLGSSNGTLLNGQPIAKRAVLHSGDKILAGETLFVVRVEGDAPEQAGASPAESVLPVPAGAGPLAAGADRQAPAKGSYTVEQCASGLTLCRGSVEEIQPADLAVLLCQTYPLYLIVDFKNLGAPPPQELVARDYLFDWLDTTAASTVSPLVVAQTDLFTWPTLVAQGWGSDAVICLFSQCDKPALLEHLRRSIRAKPKRDDLSGGILGYCWPSVMAMLLAHSTPGFVRQLLSGIDAVLVELPDLPETWQVFGGSQLSHVLSRLGLVQQRSEKVVSGRSEGAQ